MNYREQAKKEGASDWDIARMCWRCGHYGEPGQAQRLKNGDRMHGFTCKNTECTNFGTGWVVQTKPDGSIPDRTAGFRQMDDTEFTKEQTASLVEMGRRQAERIEQWARDSVKEEDS